MVKREREALGESELCVSELSEPNRTPTLPPLLLPPASLLNTPLMFSSGLLCT